MKGVLKPDRRHRPVLRPARRRLELRRALRLGPGGGRRRERLRLRVGELRLEPPGAVPGYVIREILAVKASGALPWALLFPASDFGAGERVAERLIRPALVGQMAG